MVAGRLPLGPVPFEGRQRYALPPFRASANEVASIHELTLRPACAAAVASSAFCSAVTRMLMFSSFRTAFRRFGLPFVVAMYTFVRTKQLRVNPLDCTAFVRTLV